MIFALLLLLLAAPPQNQSQFPSQPQAQPQEPKPAVPKVVPVPPLPRPKPTPLPPEPTGPPAQTVTDPRTAVSFHLPAGWQLARTDGELSTFHADARSAPPRAVLKFVATLAFNPYPASTFSGAYFYFSLTPKTTKAACAQQAVAAPSHAIAPAVVNGTIFTHGHDEHGRICTEARDEILTTYRRGACLRFDLVLNTFCGETSGARDLTPPELDTLRQRLETILYTVRLK